MSLSHTFELPLVKEATQKLISDNATLLINSIYSKKDESPYDDPVVRVGLVLKTLLRSGSETNTRAISSDIIDPALEDLLSLIKETTDQQQKEIYSEELRFLHSCTLLDDMITLNASKEHVHDA